MRSGALALLLLSSCAAWSRAQSAEAEDATARFRALSRGIEAQIRAKKLYDTLLKVNGSGKPEEDASPAFHFYWESSDRGPNLRKVEGSAGLGGMSKVLQVYYHINGQPAFYYEAGQAHGELKEARIYFDESGRPVRCLEGAPGAAKVAKRRDPDAEEEGSGGEEAQDEPQGLTREQKKLARAAAANARRYRELLEAFLGIPF